MTRLMQCPAPWAPRAIKGLQEDGASDPKVTPAPSGLSGTIVPSPSRMLGCCLREPALQEVAEVPRKKARTWVRQRAQLEKTQRRRSELLVDTDRLGAHPAVPSWSPQTVCWVRAPEEDTPARGHGKY